MLFSLRRLVHDAFPLPSGIEKSKHDFSKIHFKTKEDFIQSLTFEKFESSDKKHVEILGKSFLNMLKGLFSKINTSKWEEINKEPATREILQTCLFKIIDHLINAENSIEDANKFIQEIELAHAELATLLELFTPYKREDFSPIYLNQLKIIPESLLPLLRGGLGKTAETVFAEVNVAVRAQNPKSVRTWCNSFYYEHAFLLGNDQKFETVIKNINIDKVDLYACTFNPSIESDENHANYAQRDLITDIEKILKDKPNTKHLTIAVDFTNDYFNSGKSKKLLEHFESRIRSGQLNFVFFGSGQKFDMLGMDHFYGSPFYVINNGAEHWKPFDNLFTEEVHKTDTLSNQWFCLLYEFAAKSVDHFRRLFFQNNRNVLQNVPKKLFSSLKKRNITVSRVANNTELTFIDVKIKGVFNKVMASLLMAYFQLHAVAYKVKASIRGSFGFLHPNATLIFSSKSTTLRIHSGILRSDNQPIIKFLHNIA